MKKFTLLFLGIAALTLNAKAQTTIFKETFGTTQLTRGTCTSVSVPGTAEAGKYDPQKNELFTDHIWSIDSHVWNPGVAYTQTSVATANPGACDDSGTTVNIRTNKPSAYTGASGDGNLYFNANILNSFTITGINTLNYDNVSLSFGIYGKNKADVTLLKIQYNIGTGLIDLGASQIGALSTTKDSWSTISNIILPSSTNLSLTFYTPNTNPLNLLAGVPQPIEIRIDDILITGTSTATLIKTVNQDNRKVTASNSTLKLEGFTSGNVEIFNTQGKRVYTSVLKETIEPQLAKGLYIVRVGDFRHKISL
jgi:hypothetical protein